jgi:hypothetical protein
VLTSKPPSGTSARRFLSKRRNAARPSIVNKSLLTEKVSRLPAKSLREVEAGIKLVLALQ